MQMFSVHEVEGAKLYRLIDILLHWIFVEAWVDRAEHASNTVLESDQSHTHGSAGPADPPPSIGTRVGLSLTKLYIP